jgi:hypothetical protein
MYSLIIKIILWFPFFILAFIFGAIGRFFYYVIPHLSYVFYKISNFLWALIINDVRHSLKHIIKDSSEGTHSKKYWDYLKKEEEK